MLLNPAYTFKTFVPGKVNRPAYEASLSAAENHGEEPLYICGKVGSGKTHLLQAIARKALECRPGIKICFYTAERLVEELARFAKDDRIFEFESKLGRADFLLIDDTHLLAGKPMIQEVLFTIFRNLRKAKKRVAFTNTMPSGQNGLDKKINSFFTEGKIADIYPPDRKTKIAIIRKHISANIPEEAVNWLAAIEVADVRQFEGILVRVLAASNLEGQKITKEMCRRTLKRALHARTNSGYENELKRGWEK